MKLASTTQAGRKLLLSLLLTLGSCAASAVDDYIAGTHYQILEQPITVTNSSQIMVNEFFGYSCPHCNKFDPLLHRWTNQQSLDVTMIAVPVVFNSRWEPYAKAYHLAHQLRVFEQAHQKMYDAIHIYQQQMTSRQNLADFFVELGVTEADFAAAYDSFDLKNKLRQARRLALKAKISSVPSMLIDGKYVITAQMAGGQAEMLAVTDFLITRTRQQRSE